MADTENFYAGADYGLDSQYGNDILLEEPAPYIGTLGYTISAGDIGFPSDPRTANQLQAVSQKLNTGASTVEVSAVNLGGGPMGLIDAIPKQQFKEIDRLRKLTGVDLTFHGPLVEATGVDTRQQGWDETQREQAEREMFSAVERGQEMDPNGNLVVTFHSSNGLPEPETKMIDEKTGEEKVVSILTVDERTGRFQPVGPAQPDFFKGQTQPDIYQQLEDQNKEAWFRQLQSLSFQVNQGKSVMREFAGGIEDPKVAKIAEKKPIQQLYKQYLAGDEEKIRNSAGDPALGELLIEQMRRMNQGDLYFRDSYTSLQNLFNQAYDSALRDNRKNDLNKLQKFRESMKPLIKDTYDPTKVEELGNKIIEGVNVLSQIETPQTIKPLREFAIDKASETFGNVAFKSFKRFGNNSPIISIENPPAGSGLSRADDLRDLVEESRRKFTQRAQEDLGLSKSEAKKQAEKLIGITWDVGHINMIRKFGYDEEAILKETKTIAPLVKHVHLSDNFGLEHTELPMGMGNVPTKKNLELIEKYNKQASKIKHIVETGGPWFQHFKVTPIKETFEAFGSPVYPMKMQPTWNYALATSAGYYAGQGPINPNIHHSIYGSGFSTLPIELGGQMAGQNRLSGNPT